MCGCRCHKAFSERGWGGWLCSYAILPWYISVAVKRAIQLAWNKNCSIAFISKSKKKIEEEEERKWMYHFLPPHNSFSVDPSTEMFTDSYHSPSFSHLCLDMFQKTGPFHLPSRCEEICSLMAFKTGSADNKKKRRSEKNASLPGHPPPPPLLLQSTHPLRSWVLRHTAALPRCQLCQSHWPPSAGNLIPSLQPPRTPTEWVCSVTVKSEWHSRLRLGIVFQVCVLLYSLFTAAVLQKKNPLSLNWILKRLYWRNAHRNTLLPMCKSSHYQAN